MAGGDDFSRCQTSASEQRSMSARDCVGAVARERQPIDSTAPRIEWPPCPDVHQVDPIAQIHTGADSSDELHAAPAVRAAKMPRRCKVQAVAAAESSRFGSRGRLLLPISSAPARRDDDFRRACDRARASENIVVVCASGVSRGTLFHCSAIRGGLFPCCVGRARGLLHERHQPPNPRLRLVGAEIFPACCTSSNTVTSCFRARRRNACAAQEEAAAQSQLHCPPLREFCEPSVR